MAAIVEEIFLLERYEDVPAILTLDDDTAVLDALA